MRTLIFRNQEEQLSSLQQEQRELERKMGGAKMSMKSAKSEQHNAQTHLSRLQQDEFRMKQVCICKNY